MFCQALLVLAGSVLTSYVGVSASACFNPQADLQSACKFDTGCWPFSAHGRGQVLRDLFAHSLACGEREREIASN